MPRLFVSYRRKSWPFTQRLADDLARRLDAEIFVDFSGIDEPDFEQSILRNLRASDAVLLIVSEYTFADRIHRDDDWVRREIHEALTLNKPLIMACIEGLLPPLGLPDDIKDVARMQGINFYPEYFSAGVDLLAEFIVKIGVAQLRHIPTSTPAASAPTSDEKTIGGGVTMDEALNLLQTGDYPKAIFLLEQLIETGYHSRYVNVNALLEQARQEQAQAEHKRQAALDYEEIVMLARRPVTLAHAQAAFERWRQDYPRLADSLDTEKLREQFKPTAAEPPTREVEAEPLDPSLAPFAAQFAKLETALSDQDLRDARAITVQVLRAASGYEYFDSHKAAKAIPDVLLFHLDTIWKRYQRNLKQQEWVTKPLGVTTYVSLFSFDTYLKHRMTELGL